MSPLVGKRWLLIFFGAVLAVLIATNPRMDDYGQFLKNHILEESGKSGQPPMAEFMGRLFGGMAADLVTSQTVRTDYVLFSYYRTRVGNEQLVSIGILKNFVIIESPKLQQFKHEKKGRS